MNETDLRKFRKQLEKLRSRVQIDAAATGAQLRAATSGQATGELSNAPLHLGDAGTEEFLYDINATLAANEAYLADEIAAAIDRIDEGSYGNCEHCGSAIARERLVALPHTRFCVKCAETEDNAPKNDLNEGRPRGPDDTLAPEGEMQDVRRSVKSTPGGINVGTAKVQDRHAAGEAGGGTAVGGLAGGNDEAGDPNIADLQDAAGSGNFDISEDRDNRETPQSGRSGGAVGGTPARKRAT